MSLTKSLFDPKAADIKLGNTISFVSSDSL